MKAAEFTVVAEARKAAQAQLSFFNQMLAAKSGQNSSQRVRSGQAAVKKPVPQTASKK